jgi:hypothetical protein
VLVGRAASRVRWRGGTFFSRQPQACQDAAHGRHPDSHAALLLQLGTELCQGRIGLGLDKVAHQGQSRGVAVGLAATGMRPRRNLPGRVPPPHHLLHEASADAEQGGKGTLRPAPLVVGLQNFLSKVERICFHA